MARKRSLVPEYEEVQAEEIVEEVKPPEPVKPTVKEVAPPQSPRALCVELIRAYRQAQVQSMQIKKVGDHIVGFIGDTEMCKTLAKPGQSSGETPRVLLDRALQAALPILQGALSGWANFSGSDILRYVEGKPCAIVSRDGRKYYVDIVTGKVN